MTGTYIGTWHGGNDFTGESVTQVQNKLRNAAASNVARASNGGRNMVVSTDRKRVLFDPKTQKLTKSGHVVPKRGGGAKKAGAKRKPLVTGGPGAPVTGERGSTPGAGAPGVRAGSTSGPGAGVVGSVPTSGPGKPSVGHPDGGLSPAMTGGPGLGVITIGPHFLGDGTGFQGPQLDPALQNKDNDVVTSAKAFGIWWQPSGRFSDMAAFEDALGDDSPVTWPISAAIAVDTIYNTADYYAGRPRAGLNMDVILGPWSEPELERRRKEYLKQGGGRPGQIPW